MAHERGALGGVNGARLVTPSSCGPKALEEEHHTWRAWVQESTARTESCLYVRSIIHSILQVDKSHPRLDIQVT